jgi:hypothetical protein
MKEAPEYSRIDGVVVRDNCARKALHELGRALDVHRKYLGVAAQVRAKGVAHPSAKHLDNLERQAVPEVLESTSYTHGVARWRVGKHGPGRRLPNATEEHLACERVVHAPVAVCEKVRRWRRAAEHQVRGKGAVQVHRRDGRGARVVGGDALQSGEERCLRRQFPASW